MVLFQGFLSCLVSSSLSPLHSEAAYNRQPKFQGWTFTKVKIYENPHTFIEQKTKAGLHASKDN